MLNKIEITPSVYTIGHSNVPVTRIIDLLKQYSIDVVVDVRSSPYSHYSPQFNRESFENSLKQAGLEYKFAGDYLGGRPKDPDCYKNKEIPDGKADYLSLVDYPKVMTKDWFQKGISRLIKLSEQQRVVILCSEENPTICHRHHLIGKYLIQHGFTVVHIRNNGNKVKALQIPNLSEKQVPEQLKLF